MKLYLSILVALLSTASVGLAQQAPRAATITGKIPQPPSAGNRVWLPILAVANKV